MNKPFKITQRGGEQSNHYYGKVKVAPRRWQRHKLYTDRLASERKLIELQREADQYDSGIRSRERDRLERPITELRDEYIARMKLQRRKPEHVRISEHMLDRLIELGGWKRFRDIDRESMELIISKLAAAGATASYQNKFITRAKAFVHEFLPDSSPDPLRKLHRINEKGAKRTRDRRAATSVQISSLLSNAEIPHYRKVAYALAAYNGLRRNEVGSLAWDRVHLDAPIPFIALPNKQRQNDDPDVIPLHPYVVDLLRQETPADPDSHVVPFVPDVATLKKDWLKAGVTMVDGKGRRLDFHALRHTFETLLDRTSCSRATKKKLMRHAAEDVTDAYAHAELAEMVESLRRVPSPLDPPQPLALTKTGTNDTPPSLRADHRADQGSKLPALADNGTGRRPGVTSQADPHVNPADHQADQADHQSDHGSTILGQSSSPTVAVTGRRMTDPREMAACEITRKLRAILSLSRRLSRSALIPQNRTATLSSTGPSTQVD